jgi:hypothetical protein
MICKHCKEYIRFIRGKAFTGWVHSVTGQVGCIKAGSAEPDPEQIHQANSVVMSRLDAWLESRGGCDGY